MRKLSFLFILLTIPQVFHAQERTHLPYSVYGVGELYPKGFVRNYAMGRTGIALSSSNYINNVNPASYHSIDSVSFFFDFGLASTFRKYETSADPVQKGNDMNLNNLAIGFRITRNWSASIGTAPYSTVGYKVQTQGEIEGTQNDYFDAVITGNGGLTTFYWNNSYMLFNHLSLGVSFNYLFGNVERIETVKYEKLSSDIINTQSTHVSKLYADFGLQYVFSLKKDFRIVLGGVFGNSHEVDFRQETTIQQSSAVTDEDVVTEDGTYNMPWYAGGGLAVTYKNSLTLTADYLFNDWSNTLSTDPDYDYINNNAFRAGIEYIPGHISKLGYMGGIRYRAGYFYDESYLEINGTTFADQGLTVGLGLPFMQNKTSVNLTYNYGMNGTLNNGLIKERYHTFLIGITMHDWWFLKRKID